MLDNALNIDVILFSDNKFKDVPLSREEESVYITIQTIELSEAKSLYKELTSTQKIRAIRYIFSRRIYESELISSNKLNLLRESYEESYGSLCAMSEHGTKTIALESQLITRILYIAESMSAKEFHLMEHELLHVNCEYDVITQVINSRLSFHRNDGKVS